MWIASRRRTRNEQTEQRSWLVQLIPTKNNALIERGEPGLSVRENVVLFVKRLTALLRSCQSDIQACLRVRACDCVHA